MLTAFTWVLSTSTVTTTSWADLQHQRKQNHMLQQVNCTKSQTDLRILALGQSFPETLRWRLIEMNRSAVERSVKHVMWSMSLSYHHCCHVTVMAAVTRQLTTALLKAPWWSQKSYRDTNQDSEMYPSYFFLKINVSESRINLHLLTNFTHLCI